MAPFVGPYAHFGYTPDKVWHYSEGRLYYSIIPAAVVLVGGVLMAVTRNRGAGMFGGILAALGGAWFGIGQTFTSVVLKKSIAAGDPILKSGEKLTSLHAYVETLTLFTGLALVVVFLGALAIGRFAMLAAADLNEGDEYYSDFPSGRSTGFASATGHLPDTTTVPPDTMG